MYIIFLARVINTVSLSPTLNLQVLNPPVHANAIRGVCLFVDQMVAHTVINAASLLPNVKQGKRA